MGRDCNLFGSSGVHAGGLWQCPAGTKEGIHYRYDSSPDRKKLDRPDARYYDFEDIQIPNELKLDAKKSRVFQSPNLMAGVLVLNGYVDVKSLNNFFKDAMVKDNWQAKGNFQLPPKTVLVYEKKNKRCIIFIEETMFNTHCEIWVIPTQD